VKRARDRPHQPGREVTRRGDDEKEDAAATAVAVAASSLKSNRNGLAISSTPMR